MAAAGCNMGGAQLHYSFDLSSSSHLTLCASSVLSV